MSTEQKRSLTPDSLKVKIEREKSKNDILLSAASLATALDELRTESNFKKFLDSSMIIGMAVCDTNLRYMHTTKLWEHFFMGGVKPPYVPLVTGRSSRDLQGTKGIEPVVSTDTGKLFCYWERWKDGLEEGYTFYIVHS